MTAQAQARQFKKLCEKYNLRYKRNEAGEPVSPTRKKKTPDDHLFDLHNGTIGVAVSRESKKKYTFLRNKLVAMGCKVLQSGDTEGNFSVDEASLLEVAKLLSCVKKSRVFTDEEKQKIRERLKR